MQAWLQTKILEVGHNHANMAEEELSALDLIRRYIATLKESVVAQHQEDQGEINASLALIGQCLDGGEGGSDVLGLRAAVSEKRGLHAVCRSEEVEKASDMVLKCQEYTLGRTGTYSSPPTCSLSEVATTDEHELEAFEACLREFSTWFRLWDLYMVCDTSQQAHRNQTELCNAQQSTFETSFCFFAAEHHDYCSCHERTTRFYEERRLAVEMAEAARKADFQAAARIDCLFDVLLGNTSDKNDTLRNCTELEIGTDHLAIEYGAAPSAQVDCATELTKPGDDAWVTKEYAPEDWYIKAPSTTVAACPSPVSTLAPTPAPTPSPQPLEWRSSSSNGLWSISADRKTASVSACVDDLRGSAPSNSFQVAIEYLSGSLGVGLSTEDAEGNTEVVAYVLSSEFSFGTGDVVAFEVRAGNVMWYLNGVSQDLGVHEELGEARELPAVYPYVSACAQARVKLEPVTPGTTNGD